MTSSSNQRSINHKAIIQAVKKYWGYDQLRPLQIEAIQAGLEHQDSLVVLPTGAGKSLCYQVPSLVANRTDIVVSPLISLMKDQVDALEACGYPAAALHSGLSETERRAIEAGMAAGKYRLLFVAPERLLTPWFLALASRLNVRAFAIDEAHCISHWGHDFRPEYRRLAALKEHFPKATIHAYTATATERVRQDIIAQLGLKRPRVLVGRFDRPNLVYRVIPRWDLDAQVLEVINRHSKEAAIVYCISRNDTERMAAVLKSKGVNAAAYHAGLDPSVRSKTQEDFAAERLSVVVATVAFGMGIDRSNVRCVIHAAMPKSVEQYQQETGRAGRDGLEAECVLFYTPSDFYRWESLITKSNDENGQSAEVTEAQIELLRDMQRFCSTQECRHRALSRYFGQDCDPKDCGACDVCFSPPEHQENGAEIALQVISCIKGLDFTFGVNYVVDVLTGANTDRIRQSRHHQLSEYGALKSLHKDVVRDILYQMVEQGFLERTSGDRPVLRLSPTSRDVLSGKIAVTLLARKKTLQVASSEQAGWENVDRGLFERLREVRRAIATERGVAAFIILGDATLRDLARMRPTSIAAFARVKGIGDRKVSDLGAQFVAAIQAYCKEHELPADIAPSMTPKVQTPKVNREKQQAFDLFDHGCSLDEVAAKTGRARSTVAFYLEDYIGERKPESVAAWVGPESYERIKTVVMQVGGYFLRPVFEALDGEFSYDEIRIVMRHAGLR